MFEFLKKCLIILIIMIFSISAYGNNIDNSLKEAYESYSNAYRTYISVMNNPNSSEKEITESLTILKETKSIYEELSGIKIDGFEPPENDEFLIENSENEENYSGIVSLDSNLRTLKSSAASSKKRSYLKSRYDTKMNKLKTVMADLKTSIKKENDIKIKMEKIVKEETLMNVFNIFGKISLYFKKVKTGKSLEKIEKELEDYREEEKILKAEILEINNLISSPFVLPYGGKFILNGDIFKFTGMNSYDLFTKSSTEKLEKELIDRTFSHLSSNGINIVRTWAFSTDEWHGFLTSLSPMRYGTENQYRILDYMIASAEKHDIKLIICLNNYWEDYGGIPWYLKNLNMPHDSKNPEHMMRFYTDKRAISVFQKFIKNLISRKNTVTKRLYTDEPSIFSWELINEPRCPADKSGKTLRNWIDIMGKFLRNIDNNHMISAGLEGIDSRFGCEYDEGTPFEFIHQSPYLSFTTCHTYPDREKPVLRDNDFITRMISYSDASENLQWTDESGISKTGKPFVIEECNVAKPQMYDFWNNTYNKLKNSDIDGIMLWNFSIENTGHYDEFTIYPEDEHIFTLLK